MASNGAPHGASNGVANGTSKTLAAHRPKANLTISSRVAWSLSILLLVWALLVPVDHFTQQEGKGILDDLPLLLSFRDPEQGGIMFGTHRMRDAPYLYGLFHTFPAVIWCIMMPLQLSTSFRRRHPRLHRASGYLFATIGTCLVVTGFWMPLSKHVLGRNIAYTHPDYFHIHRLVIRGKTLAIWPTFAVSTTIAVPMQSYTLYRAVKAARAKKFAEHNTWAVLYATTGYLIALIRLALTLSGGLGAFFHFIAPESLKDFLGVPKEMGPEAWEIERSAFAAASFFGGGIVTLGWQGYLIATQNPVFNEKRPARSQVSDKAADDEQSHVKK